MSFPFYLITLIFGLISSSFATVSTHTAARSENDYKYDQFIDAVRPFNFPKIQNGNEPSDQLSLRAKRFAMFCIMQHTDHFVKIGGQKPLLIKRINEEFCSGFIQSSVEAYFNVDKRKGKPHIQNTPLILPIDTESSMMQSTDSLNSLCDEPKSPRKFNFSQHASDLYKIMINNSLDQKASLPKQQKPTFQGLKKDIRELDLRFFDDQSALPKWLDQQAAREALLFNWKLKSNDLEKYLKFNLSGQDSAIESFVAGIFNHYANLIKRDFVKSMDLINSHITADLVREIKTPSSLLIVGPSGSGKTEMVQLAAHFLQYPIGRASGANLSPAGYKGDDPKDSVNQLIEHASQFTNPRRAQELAEKKGIIFIDEIDKISSHGDNFKEGSQTALLTFVEGSQQLSIGSDLYFDSRDVLFIFSGAFSHMPKAKTTKKVMPSDLMAYGFLPELVNRMQRIIQTKPLTKEALLDIMVHPKNSPLLRNFREIRELKKTKVRFEMDALEDFAVEVEKDGIGARNLYGLLHMIISFSIEYSNHMLSNIQSMVDMNANIFKEIEQSTKCTPALLDKIKKSINHKNEKLKAINTISGMFSPETIKVFKDMPYEKSISSIMSNTKSATDQELQFLIEEIRENLILEQAELTSQLMIFKAFKRSFPITKNIVKAFSKIRKEGDDDENERLALRFGIV